jgi:subtilisin family serine protease
VECEAHARQGAELIRQRNVYRGRQRDDLGRPDHGAKVLSLSLGGSASSALQTALNYAHNRGRAIFCAAGNSNRSSLDYPAAHSNAIALGAPSPCNERKSTSSCDGEYWWGSNYGTGLDFMAPGTRIHTTDIRGSGGYGSGDYITDFNGTSSATPHAAGIGALVWSENPDLTNAELLAVLQENCDDMGTSGYDTQTVYDRMNSYQAVLNAGGGGGGPTPVTVFAEGFESNTVPGTVWSAADANSSSGLDYWGDQSSSSGARARWLVQRMLRRQFERLGTEVRQQHERQHDAGDPDRYQHVHERDVLILDLVSHVQQLRLSVVPVLQRIDLG